MAFTLELKLKIINLICQAYVFLFSFLTLVIFFNVTLPEVSNGDHKTLHHLKFLTCIIFVNIWGNYVCIWYKSWLSSVEPGSPKALSSSPFLAQEFTDTSKSATTVTADIYNNKYTSQIGSYRLKEQWTNEDPINGKQPYAFFTYTDYLSENKTLIGGRSSVSNSNEYKLNSVFTYNTNLDKYKNDSYQENVMKKIDSESVLCSEIIKEPSLIIAGWSRCKDCGVTVPPRAKHCPLCRHCVLKRDHHCFFVGCCVGFHNQRFFIIFCLYAGIGGIYSSLITLLYLRESFEASHSWGYLAYLFPVVLYVWLMGGTSGCTVGLIMFLYWSILTALVCWYYFIVQIVLVYRGQTKYECLKGIKTYQGTVWKNLTSVFGRYWPIGFIIPAPFLGYHYDGIDWRELVSDNKVF